MRRTQPDPEEPRAKGAEPLSPEPSHPVPSAPDKSKQEVVPADNKYLTAGRLLAASGQLT